MDIEIASYEPFTKEWSQLETLKAVQEKNMFKIQALKSSNLEYFIPNAFRIIFIALSLFSLIAISWNYCKFIGSLKEILFL